MKRRNLISGICAAIGMLLLILDGKTALQGAQEGITLCIQTVIPSLFPFFILSILMTGSLSGIHWNLLRPLGKICRIPEGSETLLVTGFLGGYPVGAQCVAAAYRTGQLSKIQAQRMLCFCNNAGPAFLFGMVASQFPSPGYAWMLWMIQLLSAILVARRIPSVDNTPVKQDSVTHITLSEALQRALSVMASVCGWVILFRVILTFSFRWFLWILPKNIRIFFTGLLELANGCCSLGSVENIGLRFIICSIILSFGGLCVTMQTLSVIHGLNWKPYLSGKLLQSGISLVLSWISQVFLPRQLRWNFSAEAAIIICIVSILFIFHGKRQKRGSVSLPIRV